MSDNKKYYWLRFKKDFFTSLRIKKLRKLAGGDTYTIIYLKLQLLSLATAGYLEYKGVFGSFEEEMAEEIDEDIENVQVTIQYLLSSGLMEETDGTYFLPYVAENTGSSSLDDHARESARIRKQRQREREKQKALPSRDSHVTCHGEKEIEKEKEIEIDKEIDNRSVIPYQQIADTYNSICVSYPKLTTLSENRKKAIRARIKSGYTLDDFQKLFTMAEESDFLKGKNDRNWSASFDWMIKDANMVKILEGNYARRDKNERAGQNVEREEDELERRVREFFNS